MHVEKWLFWQTWKTHSIWLIKLNGHPAFSKLCQQIEHPWNILQKDRKSFSAKFWTFWEEQSSSWRNMWWGIFMLFLETKNPSINEGNSIVQLISSHQHMQVLYSKDPKPLKQWNKSTMFVSLKYIYFIPDCYNTHTGTWAQHTEKEVSLRWKSQLEDQSLVRSGFYTLH